MNRLIKYENYQEHFPATIVDYLQKLNYLQHVQNELGWLPGLHIITANDDERIVGHITLLEQKLLLTNSEVLAIGEQPFSELFVQTFRVSDAFQRRGIGRALQE